MRRAALLLTLLLAACQWVLPIHEDHGGAEDAAAAHPIDGGGATSLPNAISDASSGGSEASATEASTPMSCDEAYDPNPDCNRCLNDECCAELDRCLRGNLECRALGECVARCLDPSCQTACETQHPSGKSDFEEADRCTSIRCAAACSGG